MNPRQVALWQRLQAFEFDSPGTRLRFAARLARENGWTEAYANRVLEEYKRFCYLAFEAGHPVTPSEDVDQAWHLHLVYTRSYWEEFCPNVLGGKLHHGPTKGGAEEAAKHDDWYRKTQDSYEKHFGAKPPADVWPDSETRFSRDLQWKRVNHQENWIVPKPRLGELAKFGAIAAVLMLGVGCVKNTPLDWAGNDFLWLYISLLIAVLFLNGVVNWMLTLGSTPENRELSANELAYLQGGKHRLFLTVTTDLVRRGHLHANSSSLRPGKPLPTNAPEIERQVVGQIQSDGVERASRKAKIDFETIHDKLAEDGLAIPRGKAGMLVFLRVLPLLTLLAFGISKIVIGLERNKPVSYLVVACIATFIIMLLSMFRGTLTRAGKSVMKSMRAKYIAYKGGSADFNHQNDMVPLAVALYGVAALEMGAFGDLRTLMKPLPGSGNTASTSSGGCTGCSSGSGGDGGGGCGGGCGGCGGGGD